MRDTPLSLQCLGEFYHVVTRKYGFAAEQARSAIGRWRHAFVVHAAGVETLERAMLNAERHRLSFWDALLLATLRERGVTILFSEDMQDDQVIDGVRIVILLA
jgi:predicted nucleic acid-binding protein